jgi:DNA-directed RNA polymerase specialized sigma24 family protein
MYISYWIFVGMWVIVCRSLSKRAQRRRRESDGSDLESENETYVETPTSAEEEEGENRVDDEIVEEEMERGLRLLVSEERIALLETGVATEEESRPLISG